jgi:hypothetical protein
VGRSDRIAAVFFLALSLFICQQSTVIGVGGLHRPGPGLMSFGAGMGIGVLALAVLVLSFFSKAGSAELERGEDAGRKAKTFLICLSLFAYAVAVVWLGFVLATFAFVFFLLRVVESERWWFSAAKAALITLGNYGLFVVWLGIKLPRGVLPW